ncbi:MAG: valine--tRNA ligase [bacterium]|nr:valine--tRNA ligase [bacterium]
MNEKFNTPYNPNGTEARIYSLWEESGYFTPENMVKDGLTKPDAEAFTIVLPPPNVTGVLHLGHAYEDALQDTIVRFARMSGKRALWIPGTDSAAIATQSRVEQNIKKEEGKNRYDIGREELVRRVAEFARKSESTILNQVRKMGASLDWSRYAYTLDEKRSLAVSVAFKRMYDAGLIYRGHRIVNWDPKGQTTISDDEMVYEDQKTPFYYFKYGPFTIGTSRPETKFGDKHVVVHPDDTRYADFKHGDTFVLEWINGPITATVIKDDMMDMEMGTGAMTITPWHSAPDFELATRHNIPKEQVIDKYGKMLPIAGDFAGLKIAEAREKIVERLSEKGLLARVDDTYENRIPTAERTGGIIEPQIMEQWFLAVNKPFTLEHSSIPGIQSGTRLTLKELMRATVEHGGVDIPQDGVRSSYVHWIDNLRDWCLSRQIWFGHRIPVWYKDDEIYCDVVPPTEAGWEQDADVLDTWFSSALWTFSTLGWPENTNDLQTYHPTSFMSPAYEILYLWISRMILMAGFHLGEVPFKRVMIHGVVRDSKGRKFSKSLGNGIDPLTVIDAYGADALRMGLLVGAPLGSDIKFDENKIKAYKHFANKVWNITRFIEMNTQDFDEAETSFERDKEIIAVLEEKKARIHSLLSEYKVYLAAEELYHYVWHEIADTIIEEMKERLVGPERYAAQHTLRKLLIGTLQMLHPFMPFITEEIWQTLDYTEGILMTKNWA